MIVKQAVLDELRGRLPDYLRDTGRSAGICGKICCINPDHVDRNPSMGYDRKTKRLHCFGCGKSYDLFDVIGLDYSGCDSFILQVKKACELFGVVSEGAGEAKRVSLKKGVSSSGDYTLFVKENIERLGAGGEYFFSRGISLEICKEHQLFEKDGWAYLPVIEQGRCISYCARNIADGSPKYRNSPGGMGLFGGDLLYGRASGDLVITESIFDALSVEECGLQAVALCGAGNTEKFLKACEKNPVLQNCQFLLAGDADVAGRRMNEALEFGLRKLGLSCVCVEIPGKAKDINEAFLTDRKALEDALRVSKGEHSVMCAMSLLGALKASGEGQHKQSVSTGLVGLDKMLGGGLYTGLYVLGAISSLGKTSLALQIADTIAENGSDVLYFTLEMSGLELLSKSISRLSSRMDGLKIAAGARTMRQVLTGEKSATLDYAIAQYEDGPGKRMFFVEKGVGSEEIRKIVEKHIRLRGTQPVVFVDYLQILKPADGRATDKQNTDRAVIGLKRLSRDLGIPVFAISSFNRENYRNCVSMESFKESGAVEYSSDVLLGMQLSGAGESRFDINTAKMKTPRSLELVMLKNRAGAAYGKLSLRYYPKYSLFCE